MPLTNNPILRTDVYKYAHPSLYPTDLTQVSSYLESRVGAKYPYTVFYGLQYYCKEYLSKPITHKHVDEAAEILAYIFNKDSVFDREMWHDLVSDTKGYWPVSIKAPKEGTCIPTSNVLMRLDSTNPNYPWVGGFLETLLMKLWYPMTIATQSRVIKETLIPFRRQTGIPEYLDDYMVHDFGDRGSTSEESSAIGGSAHLLSFVGSDTTEADVFLRDYYNSQGRVKSIVAAEHSTVLAWGRDGEGAFLDNLLDKNPTGLVATPIDTYDPENFILNIVAKRKERILARDGCLVLRPDSGDPNPMMLQTLSWLEQIFGSIKNSEGYKWIPPQVGTIYGDSMDKNTMQSMFWHLRSAGWACGNAFGSGGGLLQKVNRDDQRFAIKPSYVARNNTIIPIRKEVKSDPTKASKAGSLALVLENGTYTTKDKLNPSFQGEDLLETVWENGVLLREQDITDVIERCRVST